MVALAHSTESSEQERTQTYLLGDNLLRTIFEYLEPGCLRIVGSVDQRLHRLTADVLRKYPEVWRFDIVTPTEPSLMESIQRYQVFPHDDGIVLTEPGEPMVSSDEIVVPNYVVLSDHLVNEKPMWECPSGNRNEGLRLEWSRIRQAWVLDWEGAVCHYVIAGRLPYLTESRVDKPFIRKYKWYTRKYKEFIDDKSFGALRLTPWTTDDVKRWELNCDGYERTRDELSNRRMKRESHDTKT